MKWHRPSDNRSIANVSRKRASKLIAQHIDSPEREKIQPLFLGDLPLVEELEAQYLMESGRERC